MVQAVGASPSYPYVKQVKSVLNTYTYLSSERVFCMQKVTNTPINDGHFLRRSGKRDFISLRSSGFPDHRLFRTSLHAIRNLCPIFFDSAYKVGIAAIIHRLLTLKS